LNRKFIDELKIKIYEYEKSEKGYESMKAVQVVLAIYRM